MIQRIFLVCLSSFSLQAQNLDFLRLVAADRSHPASTPWQAMNNLSRYLKQQPDGGTVPPAQLKQQAEAKQDLPALALMLNLKGGQSKRKQAYDEAKELPQTPYLSVSEVAYSAGFSHPNHFSRAVSQQFGQTPTKVQQP